MLSRLLGRRGAGPRLSVVVPVYEVEPYLAECLDSILTQEFGDLEIVMVDDGSTDGSADIAESYAGRHRNVRLIQTENRGLSAARNLGAQQAVGEYVAFVDSDDTLPRDAYQALVSTIEQSGSDLVVGSLWQLIAGELVEPAWIQRGHDVRRIGTTIDELPQIMHNVVAVTKVFRRSFWRDAKLAFPEGLRYEDQVTMIEAYLLADRFDVIRRPVYVWRVRDDGSSITQRRYEISDLKDRLTTKAMTTDVVRALGSTKVLDYWARNGLGGDLSVYFREIPGCDDEYWELLHQGVRDLFAGLPPIHESRLRVPQRLLGWLVTQGRRSDAETVLRWLEDHPGPLPLRVEGDHVVADLPFADDRSTGIPPEVFWLADRELEHDARLVDLRWEGSSLVVSGWALVRGAPTAGVDVDILVGLESTDGTVTPLAVQRWLAPEATAWVQRGDQNYDDSGFTTRIDATTLAAPTAGAAAASWRLAIDVGVGGIRRVGRFWTKAADLDVTRLADSPGHIDVSFEAGEGLLIEARRPTMGPRWLRWV